LGSLTSQVCEWLEQGYITSAQADQLYHRLSVRPDASRWRALIAGLLLWFGALSLVCGVIFFFAYNWQSLDRFAKFALLETAILLAVSAFVWLYYRAACQLSIASNTPSVTVSRSQGKPFGTTVANAVLLAACVLVGGLLALVGQTYQTGADPWQLFAVWALVILPLAWIAGFDALWLLVVGLVNLSLGLFFDISADFWLPFEDVQIQLLVFALLNTLIYYVFTYLDHIKVGRWHTPILQYACSMFAMGCFTWLVSWLILNIDRSDSFYLWVSGIYILNLVLGFYVFYYLLPQIYPLALGGFSLIAVTAIFLIKLIFEDSDPIGGFLFIGLYILLASTGLSLWLKKVNQNLKFASGAQVVASHGKRGGNHE